MDNVIHLPSWPDATPGEMIALAAAIGRGLAARFAGAQDVMSDDARRYAGGIKYDVLDEAGAT